jgi:hypothetical protein
MEFQSYIVLVSVMKDDFFLMSMWTGVVCNNQCHCFERRALVSIGAGKIIGWFSLLFRPTRPLTWALSILYHIFRKQILLLLKGINVNFSTHTG